MSVNLLKEKDFSTISCSQVSADGHELTNLIGSEKSETIFSKPKGFRVEYFIKGPIDIIIDFKIPIDVSHILLKSDQVNSIEIIPDDSAALKWRDLPLTLLCIKNNCYQTRNFLLTMPSPPLPANVNEFQIPSRFIPHFMCTKTIKVRLMRTIDGSPAGLTVLELWGQPGKYCSRLELNEFITAIKKHVKEVPLPKSQNKLPATVQSAPPIEFKVPKEFYNALTCEMMAKPMLLPSGYAIDDSTLEKYIKEEALWGRISNNPFTCIPFCNSSTPIPNSALKAQIDILSEAASEPPKAKKLKIDESFDDVQKEALNHEKNVSKSLDLALQETLVSLKKFTKPKYAIP